MKCPKCGETPSTLKSSFAITKEKIKEAQKGVTKCINCGTELTFKTNKFGMTEHKPPFYIYFSLFLIVLIFSAWAFLFNYDKIMADMPSVLVIGVLLLIMAITVVGATKIDLAHRYVIIYDPSDTIEVDKKTSFFGFIILMAYAVLIIFGFGYLNKLSLEQNFSPVLNIIASIAFLTISIYIAFLIYKVTIHDKATPVE